MSDSMIGQAQQRADREEIEKRFSTIPADRLSPPDKAQMDLIRQKGKELALAIADAPGDGFDRRKAMDHALSAVMWANHAVSHRED